jgi:putative Mg2+ transporter-C (MgtC) family protein
VGYCVNVTIFIVRLAVAVLLGAIIGLERQWRHRMAGTRTNALVAAGAAAFVIAGALIKGDASGEARVASYVVSGIGFLGAGVIFKEGASVRGLNTAATIWCSAAVGTLAGMGYPLYSVLTAAAVLLTNITLRPLTYRLRPELRDRETDYQFDLVCSGQDEAHVRALLLNGIDRSRVSLNALTTESINETNRVRVSAELKASCRSDECLEQLVTRFSLEGGVSSVSWRVITPPAA